MNDQDQNISGQPHQDNPSHSKPDPKRAAGQTGGKPHRAQENQVPAEESKKRDKSSDLSASKKPDAIRASSKSDVDEAGEGHKGPRSVSTVNTVEALKPDQVADDDEQTTTAPGSRDRKDETKSPRGSVAPAAPAPVHTAKQSDGKSRRTEDATPESRKKNSRTASTGDPTE